MTDTPSEILAFDTRQKSAAAAVEARLGELLGHALTATPPRLAAAMRHATLGAGKRFRAFLVLETARISGAAEPAAIDAAAAIECLHAYSLVHDDLPAMDGDELRRGAPTVWKAYDEWTAILAGDALLTLAFEIAAGCRDATPAAKVALTGELARRAGAAGMVGGQTLDLEAEKLGLPPQPTLAHIDRLQAMKTGALITFSCLAGPILASSQAATHDTFARYGDSLGRAFQLSDDLLDVEGDAATVGKAVGKDAALGKATHVSLLGVAGAHARLNAVIDAALAALDGYGREADALRGAARYMATRRR